MQNNVTILTERTKALKTPARFIGSVETQEVNKLIENPKLKEELVIRASINSKKMWSKRSIEDIEII